MTWWSGQRVSHHIGCPGHMLDVTGVLHNIRQMSALACRPWVGHTGDGTREWLVVRENRKPSAL
jgi:hypothetical protein